MKYQALNRANFYGIGFERRDKDTSPQHLMMGLDLEEHYVHVHTAGDEHYYAVHVRDAVAEDFISGFTPMDAMRIGIEWNRWRERMASREIEALKAEGTS